MDSILFRRRSWAICTGFLAAASGLSASGAAACRSAEDHRRGADLEVYQIIRERREELAAGEPFTIDPPEVTLRQRILSGEAAPLTVDIVECLSIAAENSREYRSRREALYLVALDLTLERWRFSVQETGTIEGFVEGQGDDAESLGVLSTLGLSKLLGSGLALAGDIGFDLVRDLGSGDGWEALSDLSLNVTQPLLRGFGESIVREPLTQAEREVLYQARAYERFRRTFAFDVASRFLRVLEQRSTLENEQRNYEGLIRLRERNEAFAQAGLLNDIQVDQARQDELQARNRVIDVQRNLEAQLDELKFFLGLPVPVEIALDSGALLEVEAWKPLELEFPEEAVFEVALTHRLDYLTALDRVFDAERKVHVAEDALRPGLDLALAGTAASEADEPLNFPSDAIDWEASLELDLALDRLPERNAYRASLIVLEATRRGVEEGEDRIRADLRDAIRRLEAARESLEIQTGAVALAERRVESAVLNLEAGRASTRDVLEAQEDLLAARNAATGALTDYVLAGLELYRDMELLRVTPEGVEIDPTPLLEETGILQP